MAHLNNQFDFDFIVKLPLAHEEIAQFIGTTPGTVSRTLSEFKSRYPVALRGSLT